MGRIWTATTVLALVALHAGAAPATTQSIAPVARTRADARHPMIQTAIAELTKEIESALRRGEDPPRVQSDYFSAVVAADLQPAAVIAALQRPIGDDPRVTAYVKWQLLSGLTDELDEQTAGELLHVYRTAPPPVPQPGMDKPQRDDLERMIRNARETDADALSERFEQRVGRVERDNAIILSYRDALFAKLPVRYETLAAGFEDVAARLNVGADAAAHARTVCKALPEWAMNAPPDQLKAMARAIGELEKKKGQPYYRRLYWSESNRKLQWSKTQGSLASVSQLDEAREFLEDRIRNPIIPLKLREER